MISMMARSTLSMRVSASRCGYEVWHGDLHFLPEDPSRRRPGGGRGKGEAGAAGPSRASRRGGPLWLPLPRWHRARQMRLSYSLKFGELHFVRRAWLATRLVGPACVLVAVRHVERRRIITEPERRRTRLPNRPAARLRTGGR
jgi:hypothetical protein